MQKGRFRRIVRRIRLEANNAFRYYSAAIVALLLVVAILAAMFVLRLMGYQFGARTSMVLLITLLALLIVCMLGGVWGMILLSLTRKDEHQKEYFSQNARAGNAPDMPPQPRSALRIEEHGGLGGDAVFLIAALILWVGGTWLLVRMLSGRVPSEIENSPLPLLVTWFPVVRLTRLIRAAYGRLLFYRPRTLRKEESADEQTE